MTPGDPAVCFDAVTYAYPSAEGEPATPVLRELSFGIEPGEFCVVAGLSASGKSTVLRAACGLVPHFHGGDFAGRVTVGGLDTREHGPGAVAAVAGTLLQDPETQILMGTVRAELAFPLENRGYGAAGVARGVEEAALALGIEGLLDRSTGELSGGEQQRIALAAALAGRPQVVLLDEPTSQLDPVAADELISLLRRLNEEWGTAIVLVEHRLERCLQAADRVLALAGGRLVCDARPSVFLDWAADHAPALQTPAARLVRRVGLRPAPAGVKEARATLRANHLLPDATPPTPSPIAKPRSRRARRRSAEQAALGFAGVWYELSDGPAILRGRRSPSRLTGRPAGLSGPRWEAFGAGGRVVVPPSSYRSRRWFGERTPADVALPPTPTSVKVKAPSPPRGRGFFISPGVRSPRVVTARVRGWTMTQEFHSV